MNRVDVAQSSSVIHIPHAENVGMSESEMRVTLAVCAPLDKERELWWWQRGERTTRLR